MFTKTIRKWFDGSKAQRNAARTVFQQAEDVDHEHDDAHGDRDFDYRHDHP